MRRLVSILLVLSAAAFAAGVAIERSQHVETPATHAAETTGETTGEASAAPAATEATTETTGETLAGINTESTGLVAVAIVTSVLAAAALWTRPRHRALLAVAAAIGLAFAAFDIREAVHQSDLSNGGLLALALLVALLHLGVVTSVGVALRPDRGTLVS